MANPIMTRLETKFEKTPTGYPQYPGYQVGNVENQMPTGGYTQTTRQENPYLTEAEKSDFRQLQENYYQPIGQTMTIDDVLIKTGFSFLILLTTAAVTWVWGSSNLTAMGGISLIAGIAALVVVLVASFRKRPSKILTLSYAALEGVALGAISVLFETVYSGIVIQAVIGTMIVFAVSLVLYKTGLVKVNSRFMKIVMVGLVSIVGYSLVSLLLSSFGVIGAGGFDQIKILGIPLGLFVGIIAIIIGAMSLIADFEIAYQGVQAGVEKEMAWSCALGFMVTIVWIYIEMLRVLQIIRSMVSD